jgi:putative two-component system response regulator
MEAMINTPEKGGCILAVDDNRMNRMILVHHLEREGHSVVLAENGEEALEKLRGQPFDLVLLDVMMPEMDGYQVLEQMKQEKLLWNLPVIVISSLTELESMVKCIKMGAEDFLPKPFDPILLKARIDACLEKKRLRDKEKMYHQQIAQINEQLENRVQAQVKEIATGHLAIIFALAKLAESRDPETGTHLERVREYCKILAIHLGQRPRYAKVINTSYIENLFAASPLHDIGKVGIPDAILLKPDKLSVEEFAVMQQHTVIGAETLRAVDRLYPGNSFVKIGIELAESHHEKWNGKGYPNGLQGEAIPLSGRIVRLADVFDALTTKRRYKEPFSYEMSEKVIVDDSGIDFDSDLVDCFLEAKDEFREVWMHFREAD